MGQTMTSETLSISGNDGHRYWVGLQAKASSRGWKKTVYKGVLLGGGPRQWEKVVAKSFTSVPGTKESWTHEIKKADVAKQLAMEFATACPSEFKIRVSTGCSVFILFQSCMTMISILLHPQSWGETWSFPSGYIAENSVQFITINAGLVQMDKVSKVNRWLEQRQGHRSLDKDDWISIEEYIPGRVYRYCPWREVHDSDDDEVMASDHLQTFAHFTYKQTSGQLVACDFQGITEDDIYIFTDSIIHSRLQSYGSFDAGDYGMTEFFKRHRCTQICKDWPKPTPLTPPPSFDEDNRATRHLRFDLTQFENVVFPSQRLKVKGKKKDTHGSPCSRRRHVSGHDAKRILEERDGWQALTQEEQDECRRFVFPDASLQLPDDNPPAYSELDGTTLGATHGLASSISLDENVSRCSSTEHYESKAQRASHPKTAKSCLKKTYSDQQNFHRTKDSVLPSTSRSQMGSGEDKRQVSMEIPQTNAANVTFDLDVPGWDIQRPAHANQMHDGKQVHSHDRNEEEEEEDEGSGTWEEDSQTIGCSSNSHEQCYMSRIPDVEPSSSQMPTNLMQRRLDRDKGDKSGQDLSFPTMNGLECHLPPLQPSAPPQSDL